MREPMDNNPEFKEIVRALLRRKDKRMKIEVDEREVKDLIETMVKWGGDESGVYHLANYILECMYEQYPDLKEMADKRYQ